MANNFTALFHASGSSIMALSYLISGNSNVYYILKKFSTGYFLYDTYQSAKYIKHPLSSMYIYHHLATINYLHQDPEIFKTSQIMFWAELSNIQAILYIITLRKVKILKNKIFKKCSFVYIVL